jgi:hypothetical protein
VVTSRHHAEQGTRALRDVAVVESDRLLTGFVRGLSADELKAASGKAPSVAYMLVAANMKWRGFPQAAAAAMERAHAIAYEGPLLQRASAVLSRLMNFELRVLYMNVRQRIAAGIRPLRVAARRAWRALDSSDVRRKFSDFYHNNTFGGRESRSGEGSSLEQTATIRAELPQLIKELKAATFLDAPCGDFNWMQHVDLGVERYIGVDVVEDIIAANQSRHGSPARQFICLNLIEDVPPAADLALCRDCLVHLSFQQAGKVVQNFKRSGTRYLLSTTFVGRKENDELWKGHVWRTLNLELPPFNFPKPLKLINENCTEDDGAYRDKSLGLWRLADLDLGWVK